MSLQETSSNSSQPYVVSYVKLWDFSERTKAVKWSPPRNEDHDQMCMCAPTHTTHGPADGAHPISMFRANALRAEVARDWAQRTKTLREFVSSSLNMVVEPVFHDQASSSHRRRSLNYFLDTEKGYRIWRGHFALTDVSYFLLVTARSSEDPA